MPSNPKALSDFIKLQVYDINRSRPTVRIKPDKNYFSNIERTVKPYKHLPEKSRPALEDVSEYVRRVMIPRTFDREGPGWAPLARRTQRERAFLGYGSQHPILHRTGDLIAELTERGHPRHIEVIKVGKNARIEIGGTSEKFIQNQMGDSGLNLPSRPMVPGTGGIPVEQQDRVEIANIIRRALLRKRAL